MARRHDWSRVLAVESQVEELPRAAEFRLALAYPNSYHVGMSSLALHRVYELVRRRPGWGCERFFVDGSGPPLSVESSSSLGSFGCVAFSVSFEEDFVLLLQMLLRSGIPVRRSQRDGHHPVVVMGGACAAINPLPMSEFVDIFALGAAENVLQELLESLENEDSKAAVLERLASTPGFFVPEHHQPEEGALATKLLKLELSEQQMREPGHLPTTAIVTPDTEFSSKFLVEMSRGCPEKCRYCWATFGMGPFRWHPSEFILASLDRARGVTDQLGFVATAVGDHPEIERILEEAAEMGFRTAVSSIRIPAVSERVLRALRASGDRSVTLAPETGSDEMRAKMGKPVSNRLLLEKIGLIFEHGFTQLKLYFIIGLPGESNEDVLAIADLAKEARARMLEHGRKRGALGHIHLGVNILVPKPYTPWQREPLDHPRSLKHKATLLRKAVAGLANVSLSLMPIRQAVWQTYITRAGSDAAEALERVAGGEPRSSVTRDLAWRIKPEVFERLEGDLRWHFMRAG